MPHINVSISRLAAPGRRAIALAGAVLLILCSSESKAGNLVSIESKWVEAGASDVQMGVFLTNDRPLGGVLLTFEIRMIHVGSFIRRTLDVRPQGRLAAWAGDDAFTVENYYPYKSILNDDHGYSPKSCRADEEGKVWAWMAHDSLPDFMGEEALLYHFSKNSAEDPYMAPGTDGEPGTGTPSFVLLFDVTEEGGAFEIDTTCTAPANHTCFVDSDIHLIAPAFERGIVLIGCNSECHGDPNCDGQCNLIDLVRSIDVAFLNAPPAIDPDPRCPVENTDVNCDLRTDVLDIVRMINVQYRMLPADVEFCEPCNYIPRTGKPKDDVRTPYFRNNGT